MLDAESVLAQAGTVLEAPVLEEKSMVFLAPSLQVVRVWARELVSNQIFPVFEELWV